MIEPFYYPTFSLTISTPFSSASSILEASVPPPCAIPGFPPPPTSFDISRTIVRGNLHHYYTINGENRAQINFSFNNISNASSRNSSGVT